VEQVDQQRRIYANQSSNAYSQLPLYIQAKPSLGLEFQLGLGVFRELKRFFLSIGQVDFAGGSKERCLRVEGAQFYTLTYNRT
jgi:hypothetical protein